MKVLLHACCAPCLSGSRIGFEEQKIPYSVLWYNPNIQPLEELEKRRVALADYCKMDPFNYTDMGNKGVERYRALQEDFLERSTNPFSEIMDLDTRCDLCYLIRLLGCANMAKSEGADSFSTTLLLSKYQKHDRIRAVGESVQDSTGIEFVYMDLRRYWGKSLDRSREYEIYRQKYCGCELSIAESGHTISTSA